MKNKNKFPIFTFILSLILLSLGFYFEYIVNEKRILKKSLNNFLENVVEVVNMFEFDTGLENNYTNTSEITITSNSYNNHNFLINKKINNNQEYTLNLANISKNLNEVKTNIKIVNDIKNKKRFFSLQSKINEENFLTYKKLIENSTDYYYVDGFLNTYINNGNNNYFEAINEKNNSLDNAKYLSEFIIESIFNNIETSTFDKTKETIDILGKTKKYNKLAITIDNEMIEKLKKKIIKDLKNDDKANNIIIATGKDIENIDYNILPKNSKIIYNIYTDNYTYKIKKYEIIYIGENKTITLTYECKDNNKGIGTLLIDSTKYTYEYINKERSKEIKIYSNDKETGRIIIEKTKTGIIFDTNLSVDNKEITVNYIMNILNLKKNKSYNKEQQLTIRAEINKEPLNLDIVIDSKVTNKTKIEEDTKTSVIEKTISKEEKDRLNNILMEKLIRLNS